MPLTLEGGCHCGAVRFSVESNTPHPYQLCYCSICRKVGGSGYAINLMGRYDTLSVTGREALGTYRATITEDGVSREGSCDRSFCTHCGAMLWVYAPEWPDLVHPFASAIDSELPQPPERVHIMLGSKPDWVTPDIGPNDQAFDRYPDQSIEDWHRTRGLWVD